MEGSRFPAIGGRLPPSEVFALNRHLPLLRCLPLATLAVAMLCVFACIGAAMDSPLVRRTAPEASVLAAQQIESLVWQAASRPQALNLCSNNLQMPRAPRHRGDRPSSGVDEVEAISANVVVAVLGTDSPRPFVSPAVRCCPLAGHPLSLLRPPSLLAG